MRSTADFARVPHSVGDSSRHRRGRGPIPFLWWSAAACLERSGPGAVT
jgi:hypothetical protein